MKKLYPIILLILTGMLCLLPLHAQNTDSFALDLQAEGVNPAELSFVIPQGKKLENYRISGPVTIQDYEKIPVPVHSIQRGVHWLTFNLESMASATDFVLDLEYADIPGEAYPPRPTPGLLAKLRESVQNPSDIDRYYPLEEVHGRKASTLHLDYMVVTSEALKDAFTPLLEWKQRKGLVTRLVTIESIEADYDERSLQLKLKRCLKEHYVHKGLRWVLLGGDESVIPVQGCYATTSMGAQSVTHYDIPTDLFYACFDNRFDWNAVIDEKIGQIYVDGHDLLPEVDISRMPVNTVDEAELMVAKVLRYERTIPPEGFTERMLLGGVWGWSNWEGKSDSHHRSELFYRSSVEPYWKGEKHAFYDTGTDFPGGKDYNVSAQNLSATLNTGYFYFQFTGHGNTKQLGMETGRPFYSEDAYALRNPFPGLVLANGCHVNAYDSVETCLSEAFLLNPEGGALAFFGSTRFGFGNPEEEDMSLGPSLHFNATFARALFRKDLPMDWKHFASVASTAKNDHYLNGSSGGAYSYLLYAINAMGDPEMPLLTGAPLRFDNVRIHRLGEALTVNTGGVSECRICATGENLEEGYQKMVEGVSHFTFCDLPENFRITITAPGYLPYVYMSGPTTSLDALMAESRVWPVPAGDELYLEWKGDRGSISLFDMQGREAMKAKLQHGNNRLDMRGLSSGTYVLEIRSGGKRAHRKVMKR